MMGKGEGLTKKEAEQKAAKAALAHIDEFFQEYHKEVFGDTKNHPKGRSP